MSLNVCIFGVSGYTGSKLLYFLDKHKKVFLRGVFGSSTVGKKLGDIFQNLQTTSDVIVTDYNDFDFDRIDLIFSCLPHGKLQKDIINNLDPKIPIIDLSGDFRLESINDYEKFYQTPHNSHGLQEKFFYGLTEVYREQIKAAKFVSNPGCYPTSILLPLIPLLREKVLDIKEVIVDSKSGISGAGKQPKFQNLFSEISGNFFSYGVDGHKHYPEVMQEMNKENKKIKFTFIPHILPIVSGIQSTIYVDGEHDHKDYQKVLNDYYNDEPFIRIYTGSKIPSIKDVCNTNNVAIKIFSDFSKNKIVIVSCIDNLIKGASGQAIQNMNVMFGFDETESLI